MNRALRVLALIALLAIGLYLLCLIVLRPGTFGVRSISYTGALQNYAYLLLLFLFAAKVGLASIFADVVVAIIACVQRGQRVWVGVLIGAFLAVQFVVYLYYIPAVTTALFPGSLNGVTPSFFQLAVGVPVILLVLVYSFQRRATPATSPSALPGGEQARTTLSLNGMVRMFALVSVPAYGVYLFLFTVVAPAGLNGGVGGVVAFALLLASQLVSRLAFVAAVVAVVACFWRRQRAWALAIIGALIVVTCWLPLALAAFFTPFAGYMTEVIALQTPSIHYIPVDQALQVVVPALLALVYSFIRPPAGAMAGPMLSDTGNPPPSPSADVAKR